MMRTVVNVIDPTIPGLSIRDLVTRAADALQSSLAGENSFASRHADLAFRRALARVDSETLKDIGLDRAMA